MTDKKKSDIEAIQHFIGEFSCSSIKQSSLLKLWHKMSFLYNANFFQDDNIVITSYVYIKLFQNYIIIYLICLY